MVKVLYVIKRRVRRQGRRLFERQENKGSFHIECIRDGITNSVTNTDIFANSFISDTVSN